MLKSFLKNRSAEKDIRHWLSQNGYCGRSARFGEIELHAIQRPGWVQVFRFEVNAKDSDEQRQSFYGAMRADERYGRPKVMIATQIAKRDQQLAEWSENLITHRRARQGTR